MRFAFVFLFMLGALKARDIVVPDEFKTIQLAIDAAQSGDRILVSPGKYDGPIQLKPSVVLKSKAGAEKTVIDGGGKIIKLPGVTLAEGAVLDGFTITGFGKYDEVTWQKNWDEQGENQSYDHIGEFGQPGIGITGVTCVVKNNIVHHNGNTGIAIRGEAGKRTAPQISNNVCFRNMGGGIGSLNGSTAMIFDNRCYENFYAGVGHDGASPIVTGNECFRNIRAGIGISEGACPVVRGNRCYENRRAGIGIRSGAETRPVIEDNDCFENAMAGIGAEKEAEPIVRGNRCYRNQLAGIGCRSGAKPVLVGNHSYENRLAGIGADGAEPVIHGNRSERNEAAGIGVTTGAKAVITNNVCVENKLVGLGLPSDGSAVVVGNEFRRTGGMPPMVAVLEKSSAILFDNQIEGGGVAGVMLGGEVTMGKNSLTSEQGRSGIFLRENSVAILGENEFVGFKTETSGPGTVIRFGESK